jgi:hypothetical protein
MRKIIGLILLVLISCGVCAAQQIEGAYWFADKAFPEFMPLWQEGWSFKGEDGLKLVYAKPDMPLGGYAFVYFKNTGGSPVTVNDLTIDGIKMSEALAKNWEPEKPEQRFDCSLLISKLPKDQINKAMDLGWPAWWMPEPQTIEPGAQGEIRIRMHRVPKPGELKVGIVTDKGTFNATVVRDKLQPQFGTIGFNKELDRVYLYPRHPRVGVKPSKVFIDGKDVTASSTITTDAANPLSAIVVRVDPPIKMMTYHQFRVEYADGLAAQAGIRAWGHEMVYGMWSNSDRSQDPEASLKAFIDDYALHNINCVMPFVVGQARKYFDSEAGWDYCESKGVGRMTMWPAKTHPETLLFAQDEPDATDANFQEVPPDKRLGGCGQWLVMWSKMLRDRAPQTPVLLNIDNTYKPENWYMYHQLPDVPCVDPYYTEQQDYVDFGDPYYYQFHTRPTYVKAVATISQSSCQPKPLHVILLSCPYTTDTYKGRLATPEEKRMEVYYSIASGAKTMSYWMFPSGLDNDTPPAKALWSEIGLMGAEVRTAGPIIMSSCPVDLTTKANKFLWVKTLLSGNDTVAVITVNENVACDRVGTIVRTCKNSHIAVSMPSWLTPKDAFEITSDGIKDLDWSQDSGNVTLNTGDIYISKFVIVTANPNLRGQLQDRYQKMFADNVAKLKAMK